MITIESAPAALYLVRGEAPAKVYPVVHPLSPGQITRVLVRCASKAFI